MTNASSQKSFGLIALLGTVTAIYSSTAAPARAQSTEAADPGQIEDIVVTARRVDERLQDTPLSVSAVTAGSLERRAITNVTQLGSIAPNLSMTTYPGDRTSPQFAIRGQISSFSSPAFDPAVSLYTDDVYVARSSGNVTNLVDIERVEVLRGPQGTLFGRNSTGGAISIITKKPTDQLEGMLRVRGGNYGLIETTGVLNLPFAEDGVGIRVAAQHVSRDGYDEGYNGNRLNDDHSTYIRGIFRFAPSGSRFSATLSADYTRFRSAGQGVKLIKASPTSTSRTLVTRCTTGLITVPGCPPTAVGDTLENYIGGSIHRSGALAPQAPFASSDRRYDDLFSNVDAWGVASVLSYDLGAATVKSITSWRGVDRDQSADYDGTPYSILDSSQVASQHQFSEEIQVSGKAINHRLKYTLGGYYFTETASEASSTINLFPLATGINHNDGPAFNKSHALYGQLSFSLTDRLNATVGARHTWERRAMTLQRFAENAYTGVESCAFDASIVLDQGAFCQTKVSAKFHYWSYTAGVDYKITPLIMVYLRTDRASRSGGFNRGPTNAAGLAPFRPERVTNYEAGAKADLFDRRLRANLSIFRMDMKDIQRNVTQIITLPNGVPTAVAATINAARGKVEGAELELSARPTNRLTLNGSIGLIKTRYFEFDDVNTSVSPPVPISRTGEDFPLTPKRTYAVGGAYEVPLKGGRIELSADWHYTAKTLAAASYPSSPFGTIPGYGLLDGQIKIELDNGLSFAIWGSNILNKEYFARTLDVGATALGFVSGFPGAPRTYGGTVTRKF